MNFKQKETNNPLHDPDDENAGYESIVVERDISFPDVELVRQLQDIKPGSVEGDC